MSITRHQDDRPGRDEPTEEEGGTPFRWRAFVLGGFLVYLGLYAWSEWLVYEYGQKNRFYMIGATAPQHFDYVILGASHAMPLGYEDMNERLEEASGRRVMNLSIEGGGIHPNRLLLDYFLTRHTADTVILVLDSFVFYSSQWNEDRLDSAMLARAPLDPKLVTTMLRHSWARNEILPYVSGFTKINNRGRFSADIPRAESENFHRVYRPIPQIDRQRIAFLYPDEIDERLFAHYLAEFAALIDHIRLEGMDAVVLSPPTPARYRENLPNEDRFTAEIASLLEGRSVPHVDTSEAILDAAFYYDTDHLNRAGTELFIDEHLADLLRAGSWTGNGE